MWRLRRDANHIARRKLALDAALNGSVTLFMRFGGFTTDHGAAYQQCRRARLHKEYVSLILVPFGDAVRLAPADHVRILAEISQAACRHVIGACVGFGFQRWS